MKHAGFLRILVLAAVLPLYVAALPANAQQAADSVAPESGTEPTTQVPLEVNLVAEEVEEIRSSNWMISTANPVASEAGAAVLRGGGNAIDAMVAVQLMLGLVEPQSSGLGGGAFLLYWDAANKRLTTFDGRETAPMAATPTLFQDETGQPLKFFDAVVGGRSVGVPGTPLLLEAVHGRYGSLPWATLFDSVISLAEAGFKVSPRLAASIAADQERLARFEDTKAYFFRNDGMPLQAGDARTNAAYAETLRMLSTQGTDIFYKGSIAEEIINVVQSAPGNPGVLSMSDLASYRLKERAPVCVDYRGYDVCGMGPPSSGALTVGQILGTLRAYDLKGLGPNSPQAWRLIGDASRLAFADRGRYMADSDFVPMPTKGLIADGYLANRGVLLRENRLEDVTPGEPAFDHALYQADDASIELPSTSHFVIRDSAGNVVSMTTTIENGFGSRLMAGGFLLNNELTDFSFKTHQNGYPIANRVEPGKRPRSSMSPTIVMKSGVPYLAVGSPGGSRIIGYVAKTLIAHIDWGLSLQAAINLPNLVNRFGTYDLELGTAAESLGPALEALGYKVDARDLNSGLQGILIDGDKLRGGADPRREGIVIGE
uniref:gamma-glutamyltransferase n=1 Tax=Pararhizobium sp. IMCC3301 TaxID=3067904 RepID=UPI002740BA5A|nr:gamma-glutamyltransferase [Pararhizobium sp. IMCC3301]